VLRITMAGRGTSRTATIDRSWAMVDGAGDPLYCPLEGSAQEIPNTAARTCSGTATTSTRWRSSRTRPERRDRRRRS
jgi:hypothetical protein